MSNFNNFRVNFVLLHVVFLKKLYSFHKFYTTARRDGRDKSQLWEDDDEEMLVEVLEMKMMLTCGLDSNSVGVM